MGEGVFGVHHSPRSTVACQFGWNVTKTFCARNGLSLIIRSHQCKKDGMGFQVMHDNMLISVFSARDYSCGGNDGACILLTLDDSDEARAAISVRPQALRSVAKGRRAALAIGDNTPVNRSRSAESDILSKRKSEKLKRNPSV